MRKNIDSAPTPELSREEFEQSVNLRVNALWQEYGWQCQKEIQFRDESLKPGRLAMVKKRPKSLEDPQDKFVLAVYVGKDTQERESISKILDCLIPHELAHSVTEINKLAYTDPLDVDQSGDLNKSKHINTVHFYSGANEIATDVVAWRFSKNSIDKEKFAESVAHLISDDVTREKSGEYQPFYRDQARFTALIKYIQERGIEIEQDQRIQDALAFWEKSRGEILDKEDLRRFGELVIYLQNTIKKAEKIPLEKKK
jgi:hypothetical protein